MHGPVAQLGERLVCIQEVVGSIPVGSTSGRWGTQGAYSSVWLERTPDKREVGGSNPPRPTTICQDWQIGRNRRSRLPPEGRGHRKCPSHKG